MPSATALVIHGFLLLTGAIAQDAPDLKYRPLDPTLPRWVQLMYADDPNVFEVDRAFEEHFADHPFEKSYHTQYYKRWRRRVQHHVDAFGFVRWPALEDQKLADEAYFHRLSGGWGGRSSAIWEFVGPTETFHIKSGGAQNAVSWQCNVYGIDRSLSNPAVLFCGTEAGGVYKTINQGLNWFPVTDVGLRVGSVRAIEIHPTNPDIVYFGASGTIYKTSDGGTTFTSVYSQNGLWVNELSINPADPLVVLAATRQGLFRTADGGTSWTLIKDQQVFDVDIKPDNPDVVYMVRDNPTKKIPQFYKSTNRGASFTLRQNGWYDSTDPDRYDGGARIAVTPADPKKVYVELIGESKAGDDGFIGVYRSDDAGLTWTIPSGQVGGPYSQAHPNLMTIDPYNGGYQQGFYDLAIAASSTNALEIVTGGTSLWRSTDGAVTFQPVGGYVGTVGWIHPDIQDIRVFGGEAWLCTDGGVNYSTDLFRTHVARNRGISASDFWGFDSGWNVDVLVGGRYHNGNTAFYEGYPAGSFLRMGGAEAPTGYVNPGQQRKTIYSDLGGWFLPTTIDGAPTSFSVTKYPNESYFQASSSEFEWHPRCWRIAWIGNQHKLWKTADLGATFTEVKAFGLDANSKLTSIETAFTNPDVMYVAQLGSNKIVWRTGDGGLTFTDVTPPSSITNNNNWRNMIISVSPADSQRLFLALSGGPNGYKVFKTLNGGVTWSNLTTTALDGQSPSALVTQSGTDDGVYLGTGGAVFYRNQFMADWALLGSGFPPNATPLKLKPFYVADKLRAGCYGRGIWQCDLHETSRPVAGISVDKFSASAGSSFQFRDHSVIDERGAMTFSWQFPGGTPSSSTKRHPKITYGAAGTYSVTYTITDQNGTSTQTLQSFITVQ